MSEKDFKDAKALNVNIRKILKQQPEATSVNIIYRVVEGNVEVLGIEVVNNEPEDGVEAKS